MIRAPHKVSVVDDYHGVRVDDPYRWLEDGDAPEVRAWTEGQNARTRDVLEAYPGRGALRRLLNQLLHLGTVSAPIARRTRSGELRYFHSRRGPGDEHPIFFVRDGRDGRDRPLIDVSAMSAEGTTALDWTAPSPDGALVAWGRSDGGTEESTLHVRDVASGRDLVDVIPHTRFASIAWLPDGSGFYYTRYPAPGTVPPGDEKYHRRVYFHRLGADPGSGPLVFPEPGDRRTRTDSPGVAISPDGRWLIVRVHQGSQRAELHLRDRSLGDAASWVAVATGTDALFSAIARNDALYVLSNDGAPRSRLFAVDYARPDRVAWREVIPETEDVLRGVTIVGDSIVAKYMHDAATRLERFSLDGASLGPIALPDIGSATVQGSPDGAEAFVHFSSFVVPGEVIRVDLATGDRSIWSRIEAPLGIEGVRVSRIDATSKDGTRVPMFVVEREGTKRDGSARAILTGYGGFNLFASPAFSACALAAVERGVVWVQAVLRGGGEFGDAWHRAGMLTNKQNVFDDFIGCAEALVDAKVTSPRHLGILGNSNGGLLVAAAVTQRPDLFRAALSDVPLTDMLRYHHFRIAQLWVHEYGSVDDRAQFEALYAYSPYHRVAPGTVYPAVLFTTAESDSRVDPMHARKMAARLQEVQTVAASGERPILIRIESAAGHGGGKPTSKLEDELTDGMSFLLGALGV